MYAVDPFWFILILYSHLRIYNLLLYRNVYIMTSSERHYNIIVLYLIIRCIDQ